ncbi:MAG: hypothetical protein GMKNLPBB_03003 [Myxococcota bacterium]|nr:hypothetical protein [Myxococcota bacterium]
MPIPGTPQSLGFFFVLAAACLAPAPLLAVEQGPILRIAIVRTSKPVVVGGDTVVVSGKDFVDTQPGKGVFEFRVKGDSLLVQGEDSGQSQLRVSSAAGQLTINRKSWRGELELLVQGREMLIINSLPLEGYLKGVVGSEIPPNWPMESLKAQAVAARTFALRRRMEREGQPFHVEATVDDQVYGGAASEHERVSEAVDATRGEVIAHGRELASSFFTACCGGETESAREVWGQDLPYARGVPCKWCGDCARSSWNYRVPMAELERSLRKARLILGRLKELQPGGMTSSGRWADLEARTDRGVERIPLDKFRRAAGYSKVFSGRFTVHQEGAFVVFRGSGSGHGVGLCQAGARNMAVNGKSYRQILKHYYPGANLFQMY